MRLVLMLGLVATMMVLSSSKIAGRRTEEDRRATRKIKELASSSADLAAAEEEAMREYVDTRALAGKGCQYAVENIVILDNSYAIFDKELWLFKLLIKEIAAVFLRNNTMSRVGVVLATEPNRFYIHPNENEGRDLNYIISATKSIQRVNIESRMKLATITALRGIDPLICPCRHNIILLTAPYSGLAEQLYYASWLFRYRQEVNRFAVGTRIAQAAIQGAMAKYVGCRNCVNLQFVSECTPVQYLFLLKTLYPGLCQAPVIVQDATVMTFQIDGMSVDDENVEVFVDKFLDVVSESTGVPRSSMEVLDVRDSHTAGGEELDMRRLRQADSLMDIPNDTLLDVLVHDNPASLRESPFNIASRLETDLRNDLSPVSTLFRQELNGVPKVRKIGNSPSPLFDRQNRTGLTFQKLHLKQPDRQALADIFQK